MKYVANPVEVEAHKITKVNVNQVTGEIRLSLDDDTEQVATPGMTARMEPKVGDYWVIQSDGYVYLNPAAVFERKYRPVNHPYTDAVNESLSQGRIKTKGTGNE